MGPGRFFVKRILGFMLLVCLALPGLPALAAPRLAAQASAWQFARQRAQGRVVELANRWTGLEASWAPTMPGPTLLLGLQVTLPAGDTGARALQFAREIADLWGVPPAELAVLSVVRSKARVSVRIQQQVATPHGAVPVLDRDLVVTLDGDSRVISVTSDLLATVLPATVPCAEAVAQQAALRAALGLRADTAVTFAQLRQIQLSKLAIVATPAGARLVWAVDVLADPLRDRRAVVVDAATGQVVGQRQVAQH